MSPLPNAGCTSAQKHKHLLKIFFFMMMIYVGLKCGIENPLSAI